MSTTTVTPAPPPAPDKVAELESRLRHLESLRASVSNMGVAATPVAAPPSLWLTNILQGLTLATAIGAAFWLGSLSGTVNASAAKIDKLTDSVAGTSRESISSRLSVIETRLDTMDKKLDSK